MKRTLVIAAFIGLCLSSCGNKEKKTSSATDNNIGEICFEQKEGDDIVFVTLLISGDSIHGTMVKDRFETDNHTGNLIGTFNDGMINAEYSFNSEDIHYINQMQFKLSGDTLYQASGEMEEQNGKFIFKDPSQLKYDDILLRVKCK